MMRVLAAEGSRTTTLVQFATWNATRTHGIGSWLLVLAGLLGSLMAATFFWATRWVA